MPARIEIRERRVGDYSVTLDGQEIAQAMASDCSVSFAPNSVPTLHCGLRSVQLLEFTGGVELDERTVAILIRLGWLPPGEEPTSAEALAGLEGRS